MPSLMIDGPPRQRAWLILCGLLAPASLLMALDRSIVTIAAPALQVRYDLSLSELGLIFSVFSWTYALMQIPGGAIVSRFGPRLSMAAAIAVWSATTAITPLAGSFTFLLVARVLLAIGQSPDWPASIAVIDRLFPNKGRVMANSVLLIGLYAGGVIGAPLASHLLLAVGLEGMFILCGAGGLAFAVIWWTFYRDPTGQPGSATKKPALMPIGAMAKSRRVWILASAHACTVGSTSFYLSLFPTYLANSRGMGLARIGNYAGLLSLAFCVGAMVGGPVISVMFRRAHSMKWSRLPVALTSLMIITLISLAMPWLQSDWAILLAASATMALAVFPQVTAWSVVQDIGRNDCATLTGFVTFASNMAAGCVPLAATLLVTYSGSWNSSFNLLAAVTSLGCVLWLFVDPSQPLAPGHSTSANGVV